MKRNRIQKTGGGVWKKVVMLSLAVALAAAAVIAVLPPDTCPPGGNIPP